MNVGQALEAGKVLKVAAEAAKAAEVTTLAAKTVKVAGASKELIAAAKNAGGLVEGTQTAIVTEGTGKGLVVTNVDFTPPKTKGGAQKPVALGQAAIDGVTIEGLETLSDTQRAAVEAAVSGATTLQAAADAANAALKDTAFRVEVSGANL